MSWNAPKTNWKAGDTPNDGDFNRIENNVEFLFDNRIPTGLISMWSGTSVPEGWGLCDGTDGTPDLRDRFIVGSGGKYSTGNTGGEEKVTLSESELPSHLHDSGNLATSSDGDHRHIAERSVLSMGEGGVVQSGDDLFQDDRFPKSTTRNGEHSHSISGDTGSSGGNNSHENRPPYYALAFIMKL